MTSKSSQNCGVFADCPKVGDRYATQITLEEDDFRADVKQIRFHPGRASIIDSGMFEDGSPITRAEHQVSDPH